jgi:manganese transport protein
MIALILFTGRRDIMGPLANGRLAHWAAIGGTALVLALNLVLILQSFGVPIPGLSGAE